MEEKIKQGLDTVWKEVKKAFVPAGILSAIFICGPERCAALLKNVLNWTGEKITDAVERMLIVALDIGADLRPILSGWIRQLSRIGRKWLVRSIVAAIAYLALLTLGVALKAGPFIAIIGIISGLYFYAVSFVIEKSILAAGAVFFTGKATAELLAKIPKTVLEKIGLDFDGNSGAAVNRVPFREKLKDVRFLSVPFTTVAFWLAFFPSWRFYGFLFVILAGVLSLTLISIWKEWGSRVWHYYHWITKMALVAAIICFAIKSALPAAWDGIDKFTDSKAKDFAAWLNAPKEQTLPQHANTGLIIADNSSSFSENDSPLDCEQNNGEEAQTAIPKRLPEHVIAPEPQESEADVAEDLNEAETERLLNEAKKALEDDFEPSSPKKHSESRVSPPSAVSKPPQLPQWFKNSVLPDQKVIRVK